MAKYKIITDEQHTLTKKADKAKEDHLNRLDSKVKEFSDRKENFFQIDKNSLVPKATINFNLYKQKGLEFDVLIKADDKAPAVLTGEIINRAFNDNICEIVIEKSDLQLYMAYMNSLAASSHLPEDKEMQRKAVAIKENAKVLMKELLDDPRSGERIKGVRTAINNITDALLNNRDMIYSMLTLSKYDYYTYTHCVNVGTLSVGLGIAIGLAKKELENLGVGAMLHDIGKSEIPSEILNKQGKLDDFEYRWIQEHVREGESILFENKAIPTESYSPVLQHHEKLSGKGYPYRLRGEEIKLFGRISSIADCYDALTTQRPYKAAFKSFEALQIISKETTDYDAGLLAEFVKMLGRVKQ